MILILAENIYLEQFYSGGAYEEISKDSNKVWIVVIEQDPHSYNIESELLVEMDADRRNELLASDSYVETERNNKKQRKNHNVVYREYHFLKKIVDDKNNLIIIADMDYYSKNGLTKKPIK